VLHALARREGIRRAPKTKINNLGTNEFAKNPPFSKKELAGVLSQPNFRRERWIKKNRKPGIFKISFKFRRGTMDFKKIENLEFFKKSFKFRNSREKTLSNNLVFEPMELSPLPP
jgi:hypothetical protein